MARHAQRRAGASAVERRRSPKSAIATSEGVASLRTPRRGVASGRTKPAKQTAAQRRIQKLQADESS